MFNYKKLSVIVLVSFCFFNFNCIEQKSKKRLFVTRKIGERLWREKYRIFSGGTYSAELFTDYLTDSVKFRVFIGEHDEMSNFTYDCIGDSIIINKTFVNDMQAKTVTTLRVLSLSQLRLQHKFE